MSINWKFRRDRLSAFRAGIKDAAAGKEAKSPFKLFVKSYTDGYNKYIEQRKKV